MGKKREISYRVNESGCYICTSHTPNKKNGYPRAYIGGKEVRLNRYMYSVNFLNSCDIPQGLLVRHKCDNRMCINPNHLELGTQMDNISDMKQRGRANYANGENHGNSKLKSQDVLEIIESKETIFVLAEKFNVSFQTISKVRTGDTWSHITNK